MTEEIGQRAFNQTMNIWIIPELERRKKEGRIDEKFILSKAQIVFSLDSGRNEIRFNEEVKAIIKFKVENDVDKIEKIELTDRDVNCAHITLLLFKNNWIISFDFRYNKEKSKEHIQASKEFYESAKDNLKNQRLRPFFENAFASAELSAKSILLLLPDKKVLIGKNHKDRISKFENWARLGNVKVEFSTTLSKLASLRGSARYLSSDDFKRENPKEIISTLKEMINFADYFLS